MKNDAPPKWTRQALPGFPFKCPVSRARWERASVSDSHQIATPRSSSGTDSRKRAPIEIADFGSAPMANTTFLDCCALCFCLHARLLRVTFS